MKINKYINAFIATAIMAAGAVSCTNDDTVDEKAKYIIEFVPAGLDAAQQAAFQKVVKKATFSEDTEEADQVTFGLYSSRQYAEARYNELCASSTLDSIVNVFADENNIVDYSVNVVLKEGDNVIATGASKIPTITRSNYTISLEQINGSLSTDGVQQLSQAATNVYGVAPGTSMQVASTPKYAKTYYLETLAKKLTSSISEIVPSPTVVEDFGEKVTLKNDADGVQETVLVSPYCDYNVWYEIAPGSLNPEQIVELQNAINLNIFGAATMTDFYYDKRQDVTRAVAQKKFADYLTTYNYAMQNTVVNTIAGNSEITDFSVTMNLSAGSMSNKTKFALIESKTYTPNIVADNYKIIYELVSGSLSDNNLATLKACLDDVTDPAKHELTNKYEAKALSTYNNFIANESYTDLETTETIPVNEIAKFYSKKFMTLDFIITFKLVDSHNTVVAKNIYKASDGWKVGQ